MYTFKDDVNSSGINPKDKMIQKTTSETKNVVVTFSITDYQAQMISIDEQVQDLLTKKADIQNEINLAAQALGISLENPE